MLLGLLAAGGIGVAAWSWAALARAAAREKRLLDELSSLRLAVSSRDSATSSIQSAELFKSPLAPEEGSQPSPSPVDSLAASEVSRTDAEAQAVLLQKLEPSANEILSHVAGLELQLSERLERIETEARRLTGQLGSVPQKSEIVLPPLGPSLDRAADAHEALRDALSKLRGTVMAVASAAGRLLESSRNMRALTIESERNIQSLAPLLAALSGLSDRMNLLALNLALLASRAGEAGSPFEQSGEELRGLFESARRLSRDFSSICLKAGNATNRAAEAGQEVTLAADKTVERSRHAKDELERIATLSELLAQSLDGVRETGNAVGSEFTRLTASCERTFAQARGQHTGLSEAAARVEETLGRLRPLSESVSRIRTISEGHAMRLRSELGSP